MVFQMTQKRIGIARLDAHSSSNIDHNSLLQKNDGIHDLSIVRLSLRWRMVGAVIPQSSIMDLGVETRDNLQIFVLIEVLSILGDFGSLGASLLLRLADFDPLLHGKVLAKLGKAVRLQPQAIEDRTAVNWVEKDMVVWSGKIYQSSLLCK